MKARSQGRIFQRKGTSMWWCAYYLHGTEYRQSTGQTDRGRAQKFLNHKLDEVGAARSGKAAFIGPKQERVKVNELLDALQANYELNGNDSPQFKSHLKHIRSQFGTWRALEIGAEEVNRYIQKRLAAGAAPATINRSTQLLGQAFKLAVENRILSDAPKIRHLSEKGNVRQGFFSDAEFHALAEHLPAYLRDFTRFGYLTGWRKGEIASLRWEDVDSDVIRLRGENAKNGEGRSITLDGELGELIERRKSDRQVKTEGSTMLAAFVFHNEGNPIGDFRKAWATACAASGLGRFICDRCKTTVEGHKCRECGTEATYSGHIFHDFRRTAVRNMVRAGVREKVAMTISGHKTRSIFDRYNIVNEDDLRDAMQRTQTYLRDSADEQKRPAVMPRAGTGN